jgi:hypothetical protein
MRIVSQIDSLTTAISQSPLRAATLVTGTGTSAATPWIARLADATVVLQFIATCFGIVGVLLGIFLTCLSIRKALR